MKFILLSIVLAVAGLAQAETQSRVLDAKMKSKLKQEIDYVGSLYGTVYAPKAWKESHLGWNLPAEVKKAQARLAAAHDMHEARAAMAGLIKSTSDYHVSYSFYSTEKATLPFQVKTVEGKSIIVYIDRSKTSETAFPFSEGDEVLTLDQVPVAQVLTEIRQGMGSNIPQTDAGLADMYLTRRQGRLNQVIPRGPVTLSVKRAADDSVGTVQLAWEYTPERLNAGGQNFDLLRPTSTLFNKTMVSREALELAQGTTAENRYGLGGKKPFLPDFGNRIWQTAEDNTFDSYIYQSEDGRLIGVIRIPQYIVDDYNKAVKDFAGIIAHLEKNTSALIIDQNNNPGGSVFYLYSLVSMLSDQAMVVPKHKVSLLPAETNECLTFLDQMASVKNDEDAAKALGDTNGFPATYQLAVATQDFCQNMVQEYQSGKQLSDPLYFWGVDKINPNPVHYTKPIVLLVNSLDFSGGDFFPAIMQDNKRVTIVGTRTAGAGGYILDAAFPNSIGLEGITFTGSIAERVNKKPIENLGVTPDVELPMTVEDLRNGFQPYQKQVKAIVKKLTK